MVQQVVPYLTVYPHIFLTLNSDLDLKELICISYLSTSDITNYNHRLTFMTNTITEENKWLGFKQVTRRTILLATRGP